MGTRSQVHNESQVNNESRNNQNPARCERNRGVVDNGAD
jgi:hypothetical protein